MTDRQAELVIGVDAGGTKTVALLEELSVTTPILRRGQGQSGPGNLRSVGLNAATREISAAIHAAFTDANIHVAAVEGLCLSVAGAGRIQEQQQLQAWAETQNFARRVIVTTDAEPILAAASPAGVGIALISGTGSLAWGRNSAGQVQRVGGWGYLFGDEGSGYAIAIAALRAVALAADGRAPPTTLHDAFLTRLTVATPSELIDRIYGTALSRDQIAACAELVFEAAKHDPVARQILQAAADDLATMVTTLARRLNFAAGKFPLAIAGGVLIHQPSFRADLTARIGLPPNSVVPVPCPAVGAVMIARRLVQS